MNILLLAYLLGLLTAPETRPVTVTLDTYFNHEFRKNAAGQPEPFHYTWEDEQDSGYSQWGALFTAKGATINSLATAPTRNNLRQTGIYIIADPDTKKETKAPNYIRPAHVAAITDWVRRGGVLVLLANDSANCELPHLNQLAAQFGLTFTNQTRNAVVNQHLETGKIVVPDANPVFHPTSMLYLKGISTLRVQAPATPLLTDRGDVIMATARLGRGTVLAVGDPWIYNEYIGNAHLPAEFQNGAAARELTTWLLHQVPGRTAPVPKSVGRWYQGRPWATPTLKVQPFAGLNQKAFHDAYQKNPGYWNAALDFLAKHDLATLAPGKYPIDGDKVFANLTEGPAKAFDNTRWESHQKYIDLQLVIKGEELIGVAAGADAAVTTPYNPATDNANYTAEGAYYAATPGTLFLFFPTDLHRPSILSPRAATVRKLVVKIKV